MRFNSDRHHRRSGFEGYDNSLAGAYTITICTPDCLFSEIIEILLKRA